MPAVSAATRFQLLCGGVFAAVALLHASLLWAGWQGVLPGLALVSAWWALIALIQPVWSRLHGTPPNGSSPPLPRSFSPVQRVAVGHTVLALAFLYLGWQALRSSIGWVQAPALDLPPDPTPTRTLVLSVALFFLLFFLRQAFASREVDRRADPRAGLALLLLLLIAQTASGLVSLYAPSWNLHAPLSVAAAVAALLFPLEWLAAGLIRRFQAPTQRRQYPFSGYSFFLGALLGGRSPLHSFATSIHEAFGLEIRDSWLARYGRLCVEPLLLFVVLSGWLSTSIVIVPPDSEAVRVTWGKFHKETLSPGLHFIAPWPMERVRLVPVGRVQEFALGFDRDLGGPVLWTEVHFSGESNLLVGNGEEVLTFNVPVHFDLADALASERTSADLPRLLSNLAQRELLLATASRDSFSIMTGERDAVSQQIRQRVQVAADDLRLGARIRYVGLKDIHPPVDVAPAFQEVISAFEQRRMMIDLASANRITTVSQANSESFSVRRQAESFAAERLASVAGEAALLTGKVDARAAAPALFDFRNRLSVLEEVVPRLRLILTAPPSAGPRPPLLYDLRDGANSTP